MDSDVDTVIALMSQAVRRQGSMQGWLYSHQLKALARLQRTYTLHEHTLYSVLVCIYHQSEETVAPSDGFCVLMATMSYDVTGSLDSYNAIRPAIERVLRQTKSDLAYLTRLGFRPAGAVFLTHVNDDYWITFDRAETRLGIDCSIIHYVESSVSARHSLKELMTTLSQRRLGIDVSRLMMIMPPKLRELAIIGE